MADRTITVDVQSNLREQTQEARNLNRELDRAETQRSTSRTGSRAADAALGASGGGTTGMGRGTTGAGGRGDERDFARQAQGLGGLVHVYATFAANIYAVTAAFNALQKAADTTAMVQGADTLSARYGVSLKNVSKELKDISGQALSTADALSFANLGASAGVTQAQMGQLATVATGASKALGRDLNDAMQRIYRGAIKLEPELLDELGIMVKVDEASANYARTLGKTSLQLTDVEKRQAFTNAVIEQGIRKFGDAADIAANPYTKLTASIKDLGQNSLEVVNKGLGPIVNLLSQSPTALVAVATVLIGKLAKMAMPDILPRAEERFKKASDQLELAAKSLKQANRDVAKAFEETSAFKFISSEDQTKLGKRVVETSRKLRDSLLSDIEKSDGTGKVQLSVDTEKLRKELEVSLTKAIKSAENIAGRSGTTEKTIASKLKLASEASLQLELVKSLEGGLDKLADKELITGEARKAENIATVAVLKEQRDIKVAQLQHEGKHLQAIKAAWEGQKAITAELKKQAESYGKTGMSGIPTAAAGTVTPIIAAARTAGTSILGLLGRLGTYAAIASLAIEATMQVAKSLGWMTDAFEKVNDSYDKTQSTLKTLEEGLTKLGKAKSLQDIFELKEGQLKLLAEAAKQVDDLKTKLDEANTKGTSLDKALDWLKGLSFIPGKSGQQQYASTVAETAVKMESTGQLDLAKPRKELENLLLKQLPAWAQDSQKRAFSKMTFEKLVEEAQKFTDVSPEVQSWLSSLSKEITTTGKRSAEAAAYMEQASSSQKELNKLTKDYINSLIPQTTQTRLLAEAGKALIVSLSNIDAAAESLQGFNEDMLILAQYQDSVGKKDLDNAKKNLALIDQALSKGELTKDEADKMKARNIEEYNVRSRMVDVVNSLRKSTEATATAATNAEINIAKLNARLRVLGTEEGAFGGATLQSAKARLDIEERIRKEEETSLNEQRKLMQSIVSGKTTSIGAMMGTGTLSTTDTLAQLSTKTTQLAREAENAATPEAREKALASLKEYTAAYDSLYTAKMADYALEGKLKVVQAKKLTEIEREILLGKAAEAQRRRNAENTLSVNEAAYNQAKDYNDALTKLIPTLTDINALDLERFAIAMDIGKALELQKQAENDYIRAVQALGKLKPGSPDYSVVQQGVQDATAGLIKANAGLESLSNNTQARIASATSKQFKAIQDFTVNNTQMQLDANKQIAESTAASSADRATAAASIVKLTTQEYDLKLKTAQTDIELVKTQLELLKGQEDTVTYKALEEELSTRILNNKVLELQKEKAIRELRMDAAEKGMKAAEESGSGMLTAEYWSNLGDYAKEYYSKLKVQSKAIGATFVESMSSGIDTISNGLANMLQKNEFSWKNLGTLIRNTFSDIFKDLAAEFMKMALKMAMFGSGGPASGGGLTGLLGIAVKGALAYFTGGASVATDAASAAAIYGTNIGSEQTSMLLAQDLAFKANGGIVGPKGEIQLNKYAKGGIADSPQLAIFGEGRQNEAYVPLPDNRSIPVTLTGGGGSNVAVGDTYITVNVESGGNTDVDINNNVEMAKSLSIAIKKTVQDEFIRASRPGGMFYGK